jgi:hypothetical protein
LRVCRRYLESIGAWRDDAGDGAPGGFVVVEAGVSRASA